MNNTDTIEQTEPTLQPSDINDKPFKVDNVPIPDNLIRYKDFDVLAELRRLDLIDKALEIEKQHMNND